MSGRDDLNHAKSQRCSHASRARRWRPGASVRTNGEICERSEGAGTVTAA